jgi:hypothetical protein
LASIISPKAFEIVTQNNHHSISIECRSEIEQSKFEESFENIFKLLYGCPLFVCENNFETILSISTQLGNSIIFNHCIEFLESIDISKSKIETLLWILQFSDFIFERIELSSIVSKFAENFENISFESLSNISPSGISKILQSSNLKLKNENSLFEFLFEYFQRWNEFSIPLFSNVYFEYLNENNLKNCFELFSSFGTQIPFSVFKSFSFLFISKPRLIHKNR